MTRAVRHNFLHDKNGAISEHLRNHVHLTNCIHLKNHMHHHSPILAERSIMRDLIVLQRSRSLRDPSTSPPSWHSLSVGDSLAKKLEKERVANRGRRSLGADRRREVGRLSGTSPPIGSITTSKVAAAEVIGETNGRASTSDLVSTDQTIDARRSKGEETNRKNRKIDPSGGNESHIQGSQDSGRASSLILRTTESKDKRISKKGDRHQIAYLKTLSEQLKEHQLDNEDVESSHFRQHGRQKRVEKTSEQPEASGRGHCNGLNRGKRRKFRDMRRSRASMASRDVGGQSELSVASNTLAQGSMRRKYTMEEGGEEDDEIEVTHAPRNGCGIPWNWSRIHNRGKTFLGMAGRSLSCGLSDSRLRKAEGSAPKSQRDVPDMPVTSDHSSSSPKSDSEVLPLLVDPLGSQESTENALWAHEYSGELDIFANHNLRHDQDSDLASEARSGDRHNSRGHRNGRHRSLTQKYMPRTFRDLVGQNLVVQALSNAVLRRRVGLLYVFYGPHGTGKTSCARIFARSLTCQSSENPKPCGMCTSCIAYDVGKSRNVRELGPVDSYDFESMMDVLDCMISPQMPSQYRVFILDDCDTLPTDSWSSISKVIDLAPRRVVFVLVTTSLDHLPHIIISRCQKFFFPKLKDADIICTLQWIATKEGLEIDKDALKLIASRSDGSLRDAEMTLDQLSLLGLRISVPLVQELVGLISDEKLVDLLDLALSADTVNTVKNLREIMEAGVEPLALMSQLATIITDILAGTYVFTRERLRRKFFRRPSLSKEDTEKLRQALKTLSEAEKQLRVSNDRLTWLTAALLQLAPDQQYILPSSSADTSFNHSPTALNDSGVRDNSQSTRKFNGSGYTGGKRHVEVTPPQAFGSTDINSTSGGPISGKGRREIEEIWLAVLEKIQLSALKQLLHQEGKLISVSSGAAPTVQLIFSSHVNKSKAEKFREQILQAFESVLGSPVTMEVRYESRKDVKEVPAPLMLQASENGSGLKIPELGSLGNSRMLKNETRKHVKRLSKDKAVKGIGSSQARCLPSGSHENLDGEIVEIVASPQERKCSEHLSNSAHPEERGIGSIWEEAAATSHHQSTFTQPERSRFGEQPQRQSLVRNKVSLAEVIQRAEGCTHRNGWSRHKAISIAEKLEQENLRLEPRSRNLLCWKSSRISHRKLSRLRIKTRKPRSLLKLVPCARCPCCKSPR